MSAALSGSKGDPRISIAVLDGPIDRDHPCFTGTRLSFPLGQPDINASSAAAAHGTHVASIIFGNGGGIDGIAPDCRGIIVPVFTDGPEGLRCSQLQLARAILTALGGGAHIINVSGGEATQAADPFLVDALAKCEQAGVLVVAAAGNDGQALVHMPAGVPTVLAVGASDWSGDPREFSNFGAAYGSHGLIAPGENINGALPGGGAARRSGTSYATPVVSGTAARMMAEQLRRGEEPNALAVRIALLNTAVACEGTEAERCLSGRINPAFASLKLHRGRPNMSTAIAPAGSAGTTLSGTIPPDVAAQAETPRVSAQDLEFPGGVAPMDCGCGCGGTKAKDCGCGCGGTKAVAQDAPQRVFALGYIGYDFGTEARRDSFRQFLPPRTELTDQSLIDLLERKGEIQPEIERVTWTLNLDQTPIYAIRPAGAFAFNGYAQILEAFKAQHRQPPTEPVGGKKSKEPETGPVNTFSIAGVTTGSVRLLSGETVPLLTPAARGIIWWDIDAALKFYIAEAEKKGQGGAAERMRREDPDRFHALFTELLEDFKNLVTRKYRNLGVLGQERALNYAATAAYRVFQILNEMIGLGLIIDDLTVLASPACRTGSECYDVRIRTFRQSDVTSSLRNFQFTVDVSDTLPVSIGEVASWSERPKN